MNEENSAFLATYHEELQQLAAAEERLRRAVDFAEEQRGKRGQLAATAGQLCDELAEMEEGAEQVGDGPVLCGTAASQGPS